MIESLVFVFSFFVSWISLFGLLPWLQRFCLDQPNSRSSHRLPTPRGGGIVFVIVAFFVSILALLLNGIYNFSFSSIDSAFLLALPMAVVGFLDDRLDLAASSRYLVQLVVALVIVYVSPLVDSPFDMLPIFALLVVAVTSVINFTNFMDGLDGLVAGCMVVAITSGAIQLAASWSIWALIGALMGFLLWNWSPAKVFMGDAGSTFLGAVFAVLVLQAPTWSEALGLLLVATPLMGDAFFCVPRRLLSGQQVFQPHRLHLFQRLHQAGWSHARVSSLYIVATALLAFALQWGGLSLVITFAVLELFFGFWLDQKVAVPFAVASLF